MELHYTAHVPAGDGPFPTVVALHGWGASAHDLIGLAPGLHGGRALVLCPQGRVAFRIDAGPGQGPPTVGYGWFPLASGRPPDPEEFEKGAAALRAFLAQAEAAYPIDRQRLVLLGFSQGGTLAYDLALREPERFAGIAALSSWLPPALVAGLTPSEAHASLPALLIHGSDDPMIPAALGRESRDALLKLGVPTVFREYSMGHEISPEALRQLVEWLEEKVLSPIQLV